MASSQGWLLPLLVLGTGALALVPITRHTNQASLRSALDAVVRKQRSLDAVNYNDLHSFKYHGGDTDRKFDRDLDEEEEGIEFLPGDNDQLEMVEDGFQGLHDKLLERALLDYLENMPEQEEPVASIFRERERSSSRKRSGTGDRMNIDNKDLAKLILGEPLDGSSYGANEMEEGDDYLTALQTLYDRYTAGRGNKVYETAGPMSWGELLSKGSSMRGQTRDGGDNEFVGRDQDQRILLSLADTERSNVNGRYPIGREFGGYRKFSKRYPVAKRSPRPTQLKTTDPKVAQDLGALFGTQSTDVHNRTYKPEHDHEHDHDHVHNHEHDHDHDHVHHHDQDHDHDHNHGHGESATETSLNTTLSSKNQKEDATKAAKSKFQVRKKNIDWSQYFGIDRRKKKATFMAGQGTQNQDDEWILQRYYENMAENLKSKEDESERKDQLEQVDSKLKYLKNLIIEEALRYANMDDEADLQKVKDKLMARMVAAYSLQKMRKALSDLRNNVAAQKEAQRMQKQAQSNLTSSYRDNGHVHVSGNRGGGDEKRSGVDDNIDDGVSIEEARSCSELKAIKWRCRAVGRLTGNTSRLFIPCVKLQICKACAQDEEGLLPCLGNYAAEAGTVCDALDTREGQLGSTRLGANSGSRHEENQSCVNAALLLSQLQPPAAAEMECRNARESCLRHYRYQYEHYYLRSPELPQATSNP